MANLYRLSAPARAGYSEVFDCIEDLSRAAAKLLDCDWDEMVSRESGDGEMTYLYATEEAAEKDRDGAYAVQYQQEPTAPRRMSGSAGPDCGPLVPEDRW